MGAVFKPSFSFSLIFLHLYIYIFHFSLSKCWCWCLICVFIFTQADFLDFQYVPVNAGLISWCSFFF